MSRRFLAFNASGPYLTKNRRDRNACKSHREHRLPSSLEGFFEETIQRSCYERGRMPIDLASKFAHPLPPYVRHQVINRTGSPPYLRVSHFVTGFEIPQTGDTYYLTPCGRNSQVGVPVLNQLMYVSDVYVSGFSNFQSLRFERAVELFCMLWCWLSETNQLQCSL